MNNNGIQKPAKEQTELLVSNYFEKPNLYSAKDLVQIANGLEPQHIERIIRVAEKTLENGTKFQEITRNTLWVLMNHCQNSDAQNFVRQILGDFINYQVFNQQKIYDKDGHEYELKSKWITPNTALTWINTQNPMATKGNWKYIPAGWKEHFDGSTVGAIGFDFPIDTLSNYEYERKTSLEEYFNTAFLHYCEMKMDFRKRGLLTNFFKKFDTLTPNKTKLVLAEVTEWDTKTKLEKKAPFEETVFGKALSSTNFYVTSLERYVYNLSVCYQVYLEKNAKNNLKPLA